MAFAFSTRVLVPDATPDHTITPHAATPHENLRLREQRDSDSLLNFFGMTTPKTPHSTLFNSTPKFAPNCTQKTNPLCGVPHNANQKSNGAKGRTDGYKHFCPKFQQNRPTVGRVRMAALSRGTVHARGSVHAAPPHTLQRSRTPDGVGPRRPQPRLRRPAAPAPAAPVAHVRRRPGTRIAAVLCCMTLAVGVAAATTAPLSEAGGGGGGGGGAAHGHHHQWCGSDDVAGTEVAAAPQLYVAPAIGAAVEGGGRHAQAATFVSIEDAHAAGLTQPLRIRVSSAHVACFLAFYVSSNLPRVCVRVGSFVVWLCVLYPLPSLPGQLDYGAVDNEEAGQQCVSVGQTVGSGVPCRAEDVVTATGVKAALLKSRVAWVRLLRRCTHTLCTPHSPQLNLLLVQAAALMSRVLMVKPVQDDITLQAALLRSFPHSVSTVPGADLVVVVTARPPADRGIAAFAACQQRCCRTESQ